MAAGKRTLKMNTMGTAAVDISDRLVYSMDGQTSFVLTVYSGPSIIDSAEQPFSVAKLQAGPDNGPATVL